MTSSTTTDAPQFAEMNRPDTARWVVRSTSESFESEPFEKSVAATRLATQQLLRLAAASLPITIATSTYAPANVVEVVHRFKLNLATRTTGSIFSTLIDDATEWQYVPEPIDRVAVNELKRIWALPYRGDLDFDFRLDSD